MLISETFPSKYLKASDLEGREIRATIDRVEFEKLGENMKPVVYFRGKTKGVALNKTNSNVIAYSYGDDTDHWIGHDIILFSEMVPYQGKVGPSIRVRVPPKAAPKADPRGPAPYQVRDNDPISSGPQRKAADLDDEVPF